jgi:hypothetical protein
MKNLNEKRMLLKFAKLLGEPVDPALVASIEEEERLNKILFNEVVPEVPAIFEKKAEVIEEPVPVLIEEIIEPEPIVEAIKPPDPDVAQTGVDQIRGIDRENLIQQTVNAISNTKFTDKDVKDDTLASKLQKAELDGLKKQIATIMTRLGTLSMGGGGTGIVRIGMADDFDSRTYGENRYLKWSENAFRLEQLTTADVVSNTTLVEQSEYYVIDDDWYIGVNYAGTVTINLPVTATNGRNLVIKDESGNCASNPIIAVGTVDNDAGGFNLQINNGAIHMVYRSGWRII